jgi:hypothetical protein
MLGGDFWCTPPLYFWYFSAQKSQIPSKKVAFESALSFNEFLAKTYERNIFLQKFGRVNGVWIRIQIKVLLGPE